MKGSGKGNPGREWWSAGLIVIKGSSLQMSGSDLIMRHDQIPVCVSALTLSALSKLTADEINKNIAIKCSIQILYLAFDALSKTLCSEIALAKLFHFSQLKICLLNCLRNKNKNRNIIIVYELME